MEKIIINESHIRQLVKETLENLILGEDDLNTMSAKYYIENATSKTLDYFNVKDKTGEIGLVYQGEYGEFYIEAKFEIYGDFNDYDPGDYWTPPSGGEFEMSDLMVYDIVTYLEGEKIEMTEEDYNYIEEVVKKYCNNNTDKIIGGINPEHFIYEPDYDDYDD
jgi:hypothetical protein